MGELQLAHGLDWFLHDSMGNSGNQASTRLSQSGSGIHANAHEL